MKPQNKKWTPEEKRKLKELYDSGHTNEQIAEIIGRTSAAVACQKCQLNLNPRGYNIWTPEELALLMELVGQGLDDKDIAVRIDRTPNAIRNQRMILELRLPPKEPGLKDGEPWTETEEQEVYSLKFYGYDWEDIAKDLDRSPQSIKNRYYKHIRRNDAYKIETNNKKTGKPYTGPSITEINRKAEARGMTYGQYVAMKYAEQQMEEQETNWN